VVDKYGFVHINVLDALKKEVATDSESGKQIKSCMEAGKHVPTPLVLDCLEAAMTGQEAKVFLIEGYPKSTDNVKCWDQRFKTRYTVMYCFYFHCARATLEKRLLARGEASGRADDSKALIKTRLDTYEKETRPVVELYTKTNQIIHINSERAVDSVFKQICSYVDNLVQGIEVRLPEVVFFSGGLGSGKATALKQVQEKYPFATIDCSTVLRTAAEQNEDVKKCIEAGELVSSDMVVKLLGDEMDKVENQCYVITGFPKSLDNWTAWNRQMQNTCHVKSFFHFECS
jgi:UMP-CMP kinase